MPHHVRVTVDGVDRLFAPDVTVTLGRSQAADVRTDDERVSGLHARLRCTDAGWEVQDASSRNGTYVDDRRVDVAAVAGTTVLHLGGPDGVAVVLREVPADRPGTLRIGRSPGQDIVVDDLLVSRHHADIVVEGDAARIVDRASSNGVYVNGHQVQDRVLAVGDLVGLGGQTLRWDGRTLVVLPEEQAPSFRAERISVRTGSGATLLDDVSLALAPRSLLAVIGPSGAGKTTLLGALTGLRPATSGTVRWNKRDLYEHYEQLRKRIGLVPQEDILHPQLTVRRALAFAAQLRFPTDTTEQERSERVEQVLVEVGLVERGDLRIEQLSGGQRKRTSVALELLTAPPLIFLDEPTSGLDPGLDRQVMMLLRQLADAGRTVVVVTHSVLNLDVCDRVLLLAPGGRTAYFGPPDQLLAFFGVADHSSVYLALEEGRELWPARFADSPLAARYLGAGRAQPLPSVSVQTGPPGGARDTPGAVRQFVTLCRRYLAVIGADRQYVALIVGMPLVLAVLAHAVPGSAGLAVPQGLGGSEATQRLIVMVIAGALMGTGMSVRELVKERAIYRRERAVGLVPGAYLLSKLAVLGCITAAQATVFAVLALLGVTGPPDPLVLGSGRLEVVLACVGVTVASMAYGLVLSALVSEPEQTMPLMVLVVMAQVVLCGGLVPVAGRAGLEQLSWLAPAHWGYSASSATVGLLTQPDPRQPRDWSSRHQPDVWLADVGILAAATVLAAALVAALLARSVRRRPLA